MHTKRPLTDMNNTRIPLEHSVQLHIAEAPSYGINPDTNRADINTRRYPCSSLEELPNNLYSDNQEILDLKTKALRLCNDGLEHQISMMQHYTNVDASVYSTSKARIMNQVRSMIRDLQLKQYWQAGTELGGNATMPQDDDEIANCVERVSKL